MEDDWGKICSYYYDTLFAFFVCSTLVYFIYFVWKTIDLRSKCEQTMSCYCEEKKTNVQIVSGFGVWEEAVEYYTHRSNIHRTDNILVIR